jgi:hypothetical protein
MIDEKAAKAVIEAKIREVFKLPKDLPQGVDTLKLAEVIAALIPYIKTNAVINSPDGPLKVE